MRLAFSTIVIIALGLGVPCLAQQEAGDKEIGVGGTIDLSHQNLSGNATMQFSLGKYFTRNQFFGIQLVPTVRLEKGTNGQKGTNTFGGFFGGGYRYLFGAKDRRVFPFVGAGGGAYLQKGTNGSSSAAGTGLGEVGLKSYFSQKTSFEVAYNFLYLNAGGGGGFSNKTRSQILFSLRHLF